MTKDPNTERLKTTHIYCLTVSVGQEPRGGLAGSLALSLSKAGVTLGFTLGRPCLRARPGGWQQGVGPRGLLALGPQVLAGAWPAHSGRPSLPGLLAMQASPSGGSQRGFSRVSQ